MIMSKVAKFRLIFWLIFGIGLITTVIAGVVSKEWLEIVFTFGLFSVIAALIGGVPHEEPGARGCLTFVIGLLFLVIGGEVFDWMPLILWLNGAGAVVYGLMVWCIRVSTIPRRW